MMVMASLSTAGSCGVWCSTMALEQDRENARSYQGERASLSHGGAERAGGGRGGSPTELPLPRLYLAIKPTPWEKRWREAIMSQPCCNWILANSFQYLGMEKRVFTASREVLEAIKSPGVRTRPQPHAAQTAQGLGHPAWSAAAGLPRDGPSTLSGLTEVLAGGDTAASTDARCPRSQWSNT